MTSPLMTRDEVAAFLGIEPEYVRKLLRRYGITEQRGYPRHQVMSIERAGRGFRSDLHATSVTDTTENRTMPEIIVTLPAADPADTEGDPTSWIGHLGDQWTAFEDHIENTDGERLDTKDVRDSALAMLAAVHQVELWRAERREHAG